MNESRFEELMRDAARSYREPPTPPLEAMWMRIESAHFHPGRRPASRWLRQAVGLAAGLVIGIGVGRATAPRAGSTMGVTAAVEGAGADIGAPYRAVTSRYLGQTAALLAALPSESGRLDVTLDATVIEPAGQLLTTTRLLLDSPPADDLRLRMLLEDLELVLAQVVGLPSNASDELELITDAIEAREVLPRLQSAVTSIPLNSTN